MNPGFALRRLAFPLTVAVLALSSLAAQGRKLNAPLAFRYGADATEFVLAGERLVYRATGLDPLHYSSLLSTTIDGSAPSSTLFNAGPPEQLTSTSDGTRVLFRSGNITYGTADLFSVPADGSQAAIRLNPVFTTGEDVYSFRPSPDGQHVVYEAVVAEPNPPGEPVFRRRLFEAPVDGSRAPTLLTPAQELSRAYPGYAITSDSTRVVFMAVSPGNRAELFSVSLSGTEAPVQLSPTLALSNIMDFQLSGDGSRVVYLFGQYDYALRVFFNDLVSAPVDGSAAAVRLNDPLPPNGSVLAFQVSPESSCVSYFADQTSDGAFALHRAPIAGGSPLQLTPSDSHPNYYAPVISPDGAWVAYRSSSFELFAVPTDGSRPPSLLSGSLGNTLEFEITADSQRVVFAAGQSVYSAPLDGSSPAVALVPARANQYVQGVELPPGSGRALFRVLLQTGSYYDQVYGQLYSAPSDGSATAVRLDSAPVGPVGGERGVTAFAYDPRTNQAVYRGDERDAYFFELFSAPIDGSAPGVVRSDLGSSLEVYGDVTSFQLQSDGELAAYTARVDGGFGGTDPQGTYQVPLSGPPVSEPVPKGTFTPDWNYVLYHVILDFYDPKVGLMCVPTSWGKPVPLHPEPEFGNVEDERVTPDGACVAYRYRDAHDSHLYVVPLDRSVEPLELTRWSAGRVDSFELSPDSARVVFLGSANQGLAELHVVPTDGDTAPLALNPPLVAGGAVTAFALSPDGQCVVYLADQESDDVVELYSVPIDGGAAIRLNAPLVAGGDVTEFRISPDSAWVVFVADMDTDEAFELYSAPIDGRERRGHAARARYAPTRLVPVPVGRQVLDFGFSPDSTRVVLHADLGTAGVNELYSVSLMAPASLICLNASPVAGGDVDSFQIAADGARVVYVADQDTDDTHELFSAPIDGGAPPVRLSVPLHAGRDVSTSAPFQLDPLGRSVLYNADADTDEVYELFAAPLDTPLPALRINGPLRSATPTTVIGHFSKRGVVYTAEEDTLGATELYIYEELGLRNPHVRAR